MTTTNDKIAIVTLIVMVGIAVIVSVWIYYYNINNVFIEPIEALDCEYVSINGYFMELPKDQQQYLFELCNNKTK